MCSHWNDIYYTSKKEKMQVLFEIFLMNSDASMSQPARRPYTSILPQLPLFQPFDKAENTIRRRSSRQAASGIADIGNRTVRRNHAANPGAAADSQVEDAGKIDIATAAALRDVC